MANDQTPPLPLQMTTEDVREVANFLNTYGLAGEYVENQRLLVEILDCLRRIDDKLAMLLERRPD